MIEPGVYIENSHNNIVKCFNNHDSNIHVENFYKSVISNLIEIRIENPYDLADKLVYIFIQNLDYNKNFYFLNTNEHEKIIYFRDDLYSSINNIIYKTNSTTKISINFESNLYNKGEVFREIGFKLSNHIKEESLGDSYVLSNLVFALISDPNYSNNLLLKIKFCDMPKIYKELRMTNNFFNPGAYVKIDPNITFTTAII